MRFAARLSTTIDRLATRAKNLKKRAEFWQQQADEWAEGRRYLGLDVLARCRLTLTTNPSNEVTTEALPALTA